MGNFFLTVNFLWGILGVITLYYRAYSDAPFHLTMDPLVNEKSTPVIRPYDPETKSLLDASKLYLENSTSENTRKAYQNDREHFENWCRHRNIPSPFPSDPQTIVVYISWMAQTGVAYASIRRRLSSLSVIHEAQGYTSPTKTVLVRKTLQGIAHTIGTRPDSSEAFTLDELYKMFAHLPDNLAGKRDRALFLVGIAGAFRRSELTAINVGDIEFVDAGVRILLRKSKTDQEKRGVIVDVDYGRHEITCPVKALKAWLETAQLTRDAVFREIKKGYRVEHLRRRLNDDGVRRLVTRYIRKAGITGKKFTPHSFRATFATMLAANNVDALEIQALGRWRDLDVMKGYVRHGKEFKSQRSKRLGF